MSNKTKNLYSAGEQALGYIYQSRLALLMLLRLPEETAILIEKDDDLDFIDEEGRKTLASLKHKASGEKLTDLSTDFWKSINIWLARYKCDGKMQSQLRFFLLTTSVISEGSFLSIFRQKQPDDLAEVLTLAETALAATKSASILKIKVAFDELKIDEKEDFLERIIIFDNSPRIEDVPGLITNQYMRTVRREFRAPVYERLEGWWSDLIIQMLTGARTTEVYGYEVSDRLSSITDEYKTDNLPIDFRGVKPSETVDPKTDARLFVHQLRAISIAPNRILSAIYDFYRAFEQRSSWARENVLLEGEIENYEDRLIDEWVRYKDVVFEDIDEKSAEEVIKRAARELYKWAELDTDHLRIRERVSEPYVVRGSYQILANNRPIPRVHWHPQFLERVDQILENCQQ